MPAPPRGKNIRSEKNEKKGTPEPASAVSNAPLHLGAIIFFDCGPVKFRVREEKRRGISRYSSDPSENRYQ